jgi:hypothetical protein
MKTLPGEGFEKREKPKEKEKSKKSEKSEKSEKKRKKAKRKKIGHGPFMYQRNEKKPWENQVKKRKVRRTTN